MIHEELQLDQQYYYADVKDQYWWHAEGKSVANWLDENTILGSNGIVQYRIYFKHHRELVWFKLKWDT